MTIKERILQEIENAPETVLGEALHYLTYLKERYLEDLENQEDLLDIQVAREEIARGGTVPWEQVKRELGV